jgi:hypothetical protein
MRAAMQFVDDPGFGRFTLALWLRSLRLPDMLVMRNLSLPRSRLPSVRGRPIHLRRECPIRLGAAVPKGSYARQRII